jgi:hypothetical protein
MLQRSETNGNQTIQNKIVTNISKRNLFLGYKTAEVVDVNELLLKYQEVVRWRVQHRIQNSLCQYGESPNS